MKNNFYLIFFAWIINLIFITNIFSSETFNFDVTEIEIKEAARSQSLLVAILAQ